MFVKPGSGPSPDDPSKSITFKVRDPFTKWFLPDEGAEVPETPFWRRLLRDGDVAAAEPPPEAAPAPGVPTISTASSATAPTPISGTVTSGGSVSGAPTTSSGSAATGI